MPALPSFIIEPLWDQFSALLPEPVDDHPLGCHRPRNDDRVVFDRLVQVLVLGAAYAKIADTVCSATTIRRRRDEWITAGVFERLEQICLEAYDQIVGLDLDDLTVDGCIVKAPAGGEAAGKSPVDRGKQGTKRSVLSDGNGIPLGCVAAPANRHDSVFLRPALEKLGRFETRFGIGLPEDINVHLDAGYDSKTTRELLDELGCHGVISVKGFPLQNRPPVGHRTAQRLAQPRLQEAPSLHRTPHPRHRRPHRAGQRHHHRPPTRPHRLDQPPLGHPTRPPTMTYWRTF